MSNTGSSRRGVRATVKSTVRRWVPDQPGAWVMATAPALAGLVAGTEYGRPTVAAFWLLICWILCYCVQFTVARWLKSGFSRRYRGPALVYCAVLAATGVPFVALHPGVLAWAPAFAALAVASFVAAYRRRERSLWSNGVAVVASGLMPSLTFAYGALGADDAAGVGHAASFSFTSGGPMSSIPPLTAVGTALFLYFVVTQFGSVLFVKTMIRERGSRAYLIASWIWHAALVVWAVMAPVVARIGGFGRESPLASAIGQAGPWLVVVAVLLLARAVVFPMLARFRPIRPLVTGAVEGVSSIVAFAGALGLTLA
ncbi:YwiC-like family protein [Bifidobacterium sp. CP2]|uniref:YwiC-like family protein n=1 Tax=Bifidobacterium sp. CP2 TaxID=2809025 RepID=UPI001BDD90CB|nr:YwiC-like family protein [Bifidobacterium sp. CP2]MBT1181511.1 YwiC-like family protein [Bifidobacterium sp. CP2]